jgi:hypothetical protein
VTEEIYALWSDARAHGQRYFYPPHLPCNHGHNYVRPESGHSHPCPKRYVANLDCVDCARESKQRSKRRKEQAGAGE